jgi:hypothetical protein
MYDCAIDTRKGKPTMTSNRYLLAVLLSVNRM